MARGIFIRIGVDDTEFQKSLKGIANTLNRWERDLKRTGMALTRALTVPIAGLAASIFAFSETASTAFKNFGSNVKLSLGMVGDDIARAIDLSGMLSKIADVVRKVADAFIALPDPVKKFIVTVLALVAVIGPLLLVLAKLAAAFKIIAALLAGPAAIPILIATLTVGIIGLTAATTSAAESQIDLNEEYTKEAALLREKIELQKTLGRIALEPSQATMGSEAAIAERLKQVEEEIAARKKLSETPGIDADAMVEAASRAGTEIGILRDEMQRNGVTAQGLMGIYQQLQTQWDSWLRAGLEPTDFEMVDLAENMQEVAGEMLTLQANLYTLAPAWDLFVAKLMQIPPISVQIAQSLFDIFNQLVEGIGNAIAQILVYGQSASKMFKQLFKTILATVISTLVQIAIHQLIAMVASNVYASNVGAANIGVSVARAGAAAYAAAVESQGLFGLITGIGFANAAILGAAGAATAGGTVGKGIGMGLGRGLWRGGLAMGPMISSLAEKEPELVIPLSRVERILGGRGETHVHLEVDGRQFAEIVLRKAPGILRTYGVA